MNKRIKVMDAVTVTVKLPKTLNDKLISIAKEVGMGATPTSVSRQFLMNAIENYNLKSK